ncbi:probable leucine-rich repeat receptor-like protein kinase At1g35710 [Capsicum annuum]|uniref:probable leucine-rich repeat receptor-like protein kinase At1g35710 n=1 Tax=Capsicum annuum TaxID=4072 RepID=UPI001FB0BB23|nr:probable leucine-rich repeat receptor-like protein kinase At1g35710 [Capsicum annuum]
MALEGRIPREFGNLTFLVSLDLGSNNFHGNLPQEMAYLRRLKFLMLSVNNFSGKSLHLQAIVYHDIFPTVYAMVYQYSKGFIYPKTSFAVICLRAYQIVHKLQILSLSENEFDGPIQSEIGRLSNLQILVIGANHFTGIIPQEIGNIVNFVELAMEKNQITSSVPISIFNISSLQILSLPRNDLSGFLSREIGNLTKMQILYLDENRFTVSIGNFSTSLIKSYANGCKIKGRIPNDFGNLSSLLDLDLSAKNMAGSIPTIIGNLRNLL